MEAQISKTQKSSRQIHVEAQLDHLASLVNAKPVNALSELVWNSLDADADRINIRVTDNELGSPILIEIIDNGNGINVDRAEQAFGNLGGSWKLKHRVTEVANKKMHGRNGKGRFKAFALGHDVTWETAFLNKKDELLQYSISGKATQLQDFTIGEVLPAPKNRTRGTRVIVSNIQDPLGILSQDSSAKCQLAELFALYLCNYPATVISFRGEKIDPKSVQKSHKTVELEAFTIPEHGEIKAQLDIVEWSFSKKERRICLCDSDGFALHEIEAGVRPGSEFNFTAYLRSDFIATLHNQNSLVLEELNPGLKQLTDAARNELRAHFRRRKAESASGLVQQWKEEGVYPFSGDANNVLEQARREVFDICALNVHQYLDSFRDGQSKDKRFTLRMLKTALDENPEALKRILTEVLDLPKDKQSELAELLQYTTLSAIIEANKMVTDRLQFLMGLQAYLFGETSKKSVKERSQLHRMLENETWIFGEEYLLTSSDENLNTVLRKHIEKIRPEETKSRKQKAVLRDDGTQAVIDLLLAREIPAYASTRREYLVVELKRPHQKIDLTVKAQIESYALAVAKDERFDKQNTYWTFLAISNEMTEEAASTVHQQGKAFGFFHDTSNIKIGLATWSEILGASRARLEAFREKLGYNATKDQGVALLHNKYSQYLPESFKE